MKTNLITLLFTIALCACGSNDKSMAQKIEFGIYETIKVSQVSTSIIESLKTANIQVENNSESFIIGYILKAEVVNFHSDFANEKIRLIKTVYPVDKEGKYYGIIAVKSNPEMNIMDISNTKVSNKNVEIHFNTDGANKWAEMTRKNIGNTVAFVIDNHIYTTPIVNAEIKNGMALINGLNDEALAKKISDLLNASIGD